MTMVDPAEVEIHASYDAAHKARAAALVAAGWAMIEAGCPGTPQAHQARMARAARMRHANPAVIPRNHRVEAALDAAVAGDLAPLETLLEVLANPWQEQPGTALYQQPPQPHEVVERTFCGT